MPRRLFRMAFRFCKVETKLNKFAPGSRQCNILTCQACNSALKMLFSSANHNARFFLFMHFNKKMTVHTGLLIFCDVAISHNSPQIATFRIICQKLHNSGKIRGQNKEIVASYLTSTTF